MRQLTAVRRGRRPDRAGGKRLRRRFGDGAVRCRGGSAASTGGARTMANAASHSPGSGKEAHPSGWPGSGQETHPSVQLSQNGRPASRLIACERAAGDPSSPIPEKRLRGPPGPSSPSKPSLSPETGTPTAMPDDGCLREEPAWTTSNAQLEETDIHHRQESGRCDKARDLAQSRARRYYTACCRACALCTN